MTIHGITGATSPLRSPIVVQSSTVPSYLDDLVWSLPCKDGAAGYPTLTDDIGGANATIISASAADTYPGGQVFPYADGVNDVFTAGNFAAANITNNLAICAWIRDRNTSGIRAIVGKRSASNNIQYLLYRYGNQYRFLVSSTGGASAPGATLATYSSSGVVTAHDIFICGVYQYKTDGTSEMRLFINYAVAGTLALMATSSIAAGPLWTSSAPVALAAYDNVSAFTGFASMDVKRAEIFNVDSSRIAAWIDGTNPQLRFAAGSGQ